MLLEAYHLLSEVLHGGLSPGGNPVGNNLTRSTLLANDALSLLCGVSLSRTSWFSNQGDLVEAFESR
jgi:hypothetical protein